MSVRDNKKVQTRAALRSAALRLFRTKGFDRTTIDEIAREAGVSRTTFFRYFPTKETVVFDRGREIGEVFRRWISERPRHENPLEAFEGALLALAREAREDPDLARESLEMEELFQQNPALRKRQSEHTQEQIALVAEALADRDGRPVEAEHRLAAGIGLVVSEAVREVWHASRGEVDVEALLTEHFATIRALTGAAPAATGP
ncbi:MAG TPA: TetR family transcriptional regulator [Actinomycetota bacterium]|nr:TetR family transcriptional regulator [Actinomycetota bacterium]